MTNHREFNWRACVIRLKTQTGAFLSQTVIRPLAEQGRVSRQEAAAAAERLGVGLTLLYELVARFRRRPQTSSLVPGACGGARPAAVRWTRGRRWWRWQLKRFTCGPSVRGSLICGVPCARNACRWGSNRPTGGSLARGIGATAAGGA